MEKPIFIQLMREGKLNRPWIQEGHAAYHYGKDHAIFLLWLLVVSALAGSFLGVLFVIMGLV